MFFHYLVIYVSYISWRITRIFSLKSVFIILLLDQPLSFSVKYALVWNIHGMLVLLNNFLSLLTVCFILWNLFLESCKHSFFRLRWFFSTHLHIIILFLRLLFSFWSLIFPGKFAYETPKLFVSFRTPILIIIFIWNRYRWRLLFNLNFINYLWNLTIRKMYFFIWFESYICNLNWRTISQYGLFRHHLTHYLNFRRLNL